jgi:hypothetical protein
MGATKNIRLLTVQFDFPLQFNEINRFRGAIIKTTQGKNDLFHNHSGQRTIYRYPLIQYKCLHGKAALLCIEEGIEGIQVFFATTDWKLDIGNRKQPVKVEKLLVSQHRIGVWRRPCCYTLSQWLPLNQDNYKKYHQLKDFGQKIGLLEKILLANILSFLQGIDLYVEERIQVKISDIFMQSLVSYKGQDMQSFTLKLETNISLPNYIGLGKGSSRGFGIVRMIQQDKKNNM